MEKLKGHTGRITSFLELPVKSLLVSGSFNGNLKFWSLHKGYKCINTIPKITVNFYNAMIGCGTDIVIIDSDKFTEIKRVYFGNFASSCFILLSDDSLFVGGNTILKRIESFSLSEMYMKKFYQVTLS